ncbi:MAG: hypothetical protein LUD72_04160 [Bacteroidales bacterium]|nr:hypothetical protein [Bacteroidales bacterium]
MINTKTYASKSATIFKDSHANTGLNPIMELNYGEMISRGLIYFDHNKVKSLVEDKTYPDIDKLKHVLRMVNTASITSLNINNPCFVCEEEKRMRAISFDVIFFLIPNDWDGGRGFDYTMDLYRKEHRGVSTHGCNWFQYRDYFKWDSEGIYTAEKMSKELDKFSSDKGNLSDIIFGYQHFDKGNEDISLDVTCIFNKFITGELENYGIGIMYAPSFELKKKSKTQYVGFFTGHTNSFYQPYIETTYEEVLSDDRADFYLDKPNKLYFYSLVGGNYQNLDELPICTIDGEEHEVKQATKGVYYVDITLNSDTEEPDTMHYDVWSNLQYKGTAIKDVELQFVTKESAGYYNFGLPNGTDTDETTIPSIYGINHKEQIERGDIRKVNVECRIPYTMAHLNGVDGVEYRLYVTEGVEREYDVIAWTATEKGYNENYFLLNTMDLVPCRYFVDIRIKDNLELKYHRKLLEFDIVSDVTKERR